MKNLNQGFTSLELLIAVAIAAILIVMAISGLGWMKQSSFNIFSSEIKSFIGYIRNNAVLTNRFMCVDFASNTDGNFLEGNYLKDDTHSKGPYKLQLKNNLNITSSISGSDAVVCFYPNGFLMEGEAIKPTNGDLNSIMVASSSEYFKSFEYSNIDKLTITVTNKDTGDNQNICLAKGGEFTSC